MLSFSAMPPTNPKPSAAKGAERLSFAWDREETPASLRLKLERATEEEWIPLAAWILREARPDEVWRFLRPEDVDKHLSKLTPILGRRKDLWTYLIQTWHELGKL